MKGVTGGVVDKTLSIHQSNVAIFNAATGKADRVGIKLLSDDEKKTRKTIERGVRVFRSSGDRDQGLRGDHGSFARVLPREGRPRPGRQVRLQVGDAGAAHHQDHPEHGRLGGGLGQEGDGPRGRATFSKIAGQKPVVTKSKKAIAGFKIRDGVPIGCMVTLRGVRMYEFLDRFVTIALPRVRDFRGISSRAFDGRGNYNIGVKEQSSFPSSSTTRSTRCAA